MSRTKIKRNRKSKKPSYITKKEWMEICDRRSKRKRKVMKDDKSEI